VHHQICANVCCVITALFDFDGSNPIPLLYSVGIKTIDFVKSLDFIQWHAIMHARVSQLPFIFLNMLQQFLSQLEIYSTNTVNINLVERGDNGANVSTVQLLKIAKLVARFIEQMENHILEGSYPDTVPAFTPRDANPNHKVPSMIVATNVEERPTAEKTKIDVSPPGTPALKRSSKRQKLKPGAGSKDFTKTSLFCCKEGTPIAKLFPTNLSNKYCSFFCFHNKKCSPSQSSLATLSMLASGKRSLPLIKPRFLNTVMPVVERSGWMWTLLPSIESHTFPRSLHTS
jgi:hypothetical protein